jgi:hypothetical protein
MKSIALFMNCIDYNKLVASIKTFSTLCLVIYCSILNAQCNYNQQVTHVTGTKVVGCVNVTVTSLGHIDTNTTFCPFIAPYAIGYSFKTKVSANGSYTFTFSKPINGVALNFTGVTNEPPSTEEIHIYVNGIHYKIMSQGVINYCDPIAILTPAGDIGAPIGCSGAGWSGTLISGPITTLTVLDTVFGGTPVGSLFSLSICDDGPPLPVIQGINIICKGDSSILTASGGTNYLWNTGESMASIVVKPAQTTAYKVIAWNYACKDSALDTVIVNSNPVPSITGSTTICANQSTTLTATGGSSYLWNNSDTSSSISVAPEKNATVMLIMN